MDKRSLEATRSRRYRARKKAGITVTQVAINPDVLDALVECGFLVEKNRHDREKIAESVGYLLYLLAEGALLLDDSGLD